MAGEVTPFVLTHVAEQSGGRTLATNIGVIVNNARTAAHIAIEVAELTTRSEAPG